MSNKKRQFHQALGVDTALSPGPHKQIHPDSGNGDRVVDPELEGTMEQDQLLHQLVGTGIVRIRPCERPAVRQALVRVTVVSRELSIGEREPRRRMQVRI